MYFHCIISSKIVRYGNKNDGSNINWVDFPLPFYGYSVPYYQLDYNNEWARITEISFLAIIRKIY